jgi:outer membrane protein TolC
MIRLPARGWLAALLAAGLPLVPVAAGAQPPAPVDTLRLPALQALAAARDPRARQPELQAERAALQRRTIALEALPTISAGSQAQYQSQVTRLPLTLPPALTGGRGIPVPPHDSYDASLRADAALLDPGRAPRLALRRAQLVEEQAQVGSTLHTVRQQVAATFLTTVQLEARAATLAASLTDLDARRLEAERRVRAGAALPSDAATLTAELLRRREELAELQADRAAALATLADWLGRPLPGGVPLALPDSGALSAQVAEARAAADTLRARPEFATLAARRARLASQASVVGAATRPRLGAFARAGYGRPGLNFLSDRFQGYWQGGVQLQWTPLDWGRAAREREALDVERELVDVEEAALRAQLARATRPQLAAMDRLSRTLAVDDSIITLRAEVLRETTARYREGAVTAAEYVDRQTDLLTARLTQVAHRVELTRARVDYLTTLGLEIRP